MNHLKHTASIILAMLCLLCSQLHAQAYTFVNGDTIFIDGCTNSTGILYDDGGPDGNYSINFEGWVVIQASPLSTITLTGDYNIESPTWDWLDIWDGDSLIGNRIGNSGTLSLTATSGTMTIRFYSDYMITYSGFALTFDVTGGVVADGVTDLTASDITSSSATLQWSSTSAGPFHVMLNNTEVGTTSSSTFTLNNLTPFHRYHARVYPEGLADNGCAYAYLTFRTACGTFTLPWTEDFAESTPGSMPPCWTKSVNFDDEETQPRIVDLSGDYGNTLMLTCGSNATGGHYGLVAGPACQHDAQQWMVSFDYRASHSYTRFVVGVCDSTSGELDSYGFTPLETVEVSYNNSWYHYRRLLTIPSGGCRIAFRMVQSQQSGTGRTTYLDNLNIETCGIDEAWFTRTAPTSVLLHWTVFSTPTVSIGVRPYGATVDDTVIAAATSPLLISGLTPGTQYTFTLYPVCDNIAQYPHVTSATTLPVDGLPSTLCSYPDTYLYNGNHLVTSQLADLAGKEMLFSYYTSSSYNPTPQDRIIVGTCTYPDDFSSFTPFDTINDLQYDTWQQTVVRFPDTCNDQFAAFLASYQSLSWARIRYVSINDCQVANAHLVNIFGTQAILAWDSLAPPDDTMVVQYYNTSDYIYHHDTISGTNQCTLTGLTPDRNYTFRLYRPCGTPCSNFDISARTALRDYMIPLCDDFETYGSMFSNINGWYHHNTYQGCPDRSTEYRHSGSYSLKLVSHSSWQYDLIMPNISGMAGQVLTFWAFSRAPSSRVVFSSWDGVAAINHQYGFDTVDIVGDGSWHHYSITLPDTLTGRVTLRYLLSGISGTYNLWIDDIQVGAAGYGAFSFTNLEAHSIDIVWQDVSADAVQVRLVGEWGGELYATGQPDTLHVIGLDSNTRYYCYMAPILGTDTLCFSYAGTFITPKYSPYGDGGSGGGSGSGGGDEGGDESGGGGSSLLPPVACNPFDDLAPGTLPAGWLFSDSAAVSVTDGHLSSGANTIWLPAMQGSALYIAARGLSGSDTLFVDGDTTLLDTAWRYYCHEPDHTPGHRIQLRIAGSCQLDNVGFSGCPVIDFIPSGNSILCQVRGGMDCEYFLTLTDEEGNDRSYHVTNSWFTIDNLPPSTHFVARWHCLYMSDGCMPALSVHTAAIPLPYCINLYYSDPLPEGWKTIGQTNDNVYTGGTSGYFQFYSYYSYYNSSSYHWQYIILPETEDYANLTASFYGRLNSTVQTVQIGILTNPADTSTFVPATTIHYTDGNYRYYSFDLSQLPRGRVAVRNMAGTFYMGEVSLFDAPQISYHLYRYDTLTVTSSSPGNYRLQHGFTDYYWSFYSYATSIVDTTSYPLPATNSSYNYLGIRQLDALGNMPCSTSPQCIPVHRAVSMPYCDHFNYSYSYAYINNNRYFYSSSSNTGIQWNKVDYTSTYENGQYNYYLYVSVNEPKFITFPYMHVDSLGTLSVSFRYRRAATGYPHPAVIAGLLPDALDTAGFVPVDTIPLIADNQWHTATFSLGSYHGDARWITLCDPYNSGSYTFYFDDIRFETCLAALTATAELERYNIVRIENDVPGSFYVEYGPSGFLLGEGTMQQVDTTPYRLTLQPETDYDFYFYCDATSSSCAEAQTVSTLAVPFTVPTCVDFDTCTSAVIPHGWINVGGNTLVTDSASHSAGNALMVTGTVSTPDIDLDSLQQMVLGLWVMTTDANTRLVVGTMTSPTDAASFHAVKTIVPKQTGVWEHHFVSFANAPANAHFVALRNSSGNRRTLLVDDLHLSLCGAFDVHVDHVDNNFIDLSWSEVGSPTTTLSVTEGSTTTPYTLTGGHFSLPITPLHSYQLAFHAECASDLACNVDYDDTIRVIAPVEGMGCVNPTDLQSPQAVFFSGTYGNPYAASGAIDYGANSPDSRHTVCYDTSERDTRTGSLLRTIPEGYTSSVRLGNWSTNPASPEAEGVIYSLLVDTMSFNLLMMRYAAVLQDPMHDPIDQPRFRLELLDSAFNLIDPLCAAADFIANRNLGWNEAADNVLWKEWTPVGIDVSAYAGQQIYIRLTTYDCNEGSHYGYAYFTLECMRKSIDAETCDPVDSNRFTAPVGFDYRWYTTSSSATIATTRTLVVPTDPPETYLCDLSFVGKSACSFTLSAYGGPRLPLAMADTVVTIHDCLFDVRFINNSTISPDGINPTPTHEQVESAFWDFGNGETSNNYHGHTVYTSPGIYTVTLVISISGGFCTDTLVWPLNIDFPTYPHIVGPDTLCYALLDTLRFADGTPQGILPPGWQGDPAYLPLSPDNYSLGANTYTLSTLNQWGCPHTASHTMTVVPSFHHMDTVRICNSLLPYNYTDTTFLEGTVQAHYDLNLTTVYGCDSSYHLWLSVSDTFPDTFRDTTSASICDNQSYTFFGSEYTNEGEHITVHVDNSGFCDSIHTLQLDVRPTSATDTVASECDLFTWHGISYSSNAEPTHLDTNSVLCDSVTTLHLTIRHSTDTAIHHTVIENNLPYLWNSLSFGSDTTGCIYTITNQQQCDSVITFSLTVFRNTTATLFDTICEGLLPFEWNNVTFSLGEEDTVTDDITHQTMLTTTRGADSLVTMHLHLLRNTTATVNDTLVQNALATYTPPLPIELPTIDSQLSTLNSTAPLLILLIDTTMVITNAVGCDSTVHYTLHFWRNYTAVDSTHRCDNYLPFTWERVVFLSDSIATVTLPSSHGADSTVAFHLIVYPTYEVADTIVICPYRPYLYDGVDYGAPGDYNVMYYTVHDCDSLLHLTLVDRAPSFRLAPEVRLLSPASTTPSTPWLPYDTTLLGCLPSTLQMHDTSSSVSREWICWTTDTTLNSNLSILNSTDPLFSTTLDTTGIVGFRLIAVSPEGCLDTAMNDSLLWTFHNPEADFRFSPERLSMHDPHTQFINLSQPDSCSYLWLFPSDLGGGSTDSSSEVNPSYQWEVGSEAGDYLVSLIAYLLHYGPDSLTVTCTDTATIPVAIVNTYLQFPNVVTPNGDGINDTWVVVNLLEMGEYSMNELWIYNAWGVLVYHVKNIRQPSDFWNPNDTSSPDGTYYYRFSAKNDYGIVRCNGVIEVKGER